MTENLPNDADGDALRRLVATGSDLSREMEIDFAVAVPDRTSGMMFAAAVEPTGYRTKVHQDPETGDWTCYSTRVMLPSYDAIIAVQKMLEEIGAPYNAKPDGWGSFGNANE
jgi:hypothetical protein